MFILLLIFTGVPLSVASFSLFEQDCGFSQKDCFQCMVDKIDLDRNGGVSREELDYAIQRGKSNLFKIFGFLQGSRLIMQQCDYDKNGEITARDLK